MTGYHGTPLFGTHYSQGWAAEAKDEDRGDDRNKGMWILGLARVNSLRGDTRYCPQRLLCSLTATHQPPVLAQPLSFGHIVNAISGSTPSEKKINSQNTCFGIFSVPLQSHWSLLFAVSAFLLYWAQQTQERAFTQNYLPSPQSYITSSKQSYII